MPEWQKNLYSNLNESQPTTNVFNLNQIDDNDDETFVIESDWIHCMDVNSSTPLLNF